MDPDFDWELRRGIATTLRRMLDGDDSALARVEATRHLAMTTAQEFAAAVKAARAAGRGCEEIAAHVPGFPPAYGNEAPHALFEQLAHRGMSGVAYLSWRCESCAGTVVDRGPFGGHPDDAEPGHEPRCERRRAEVRAYLDALARDDAGAAPMLTAEPAGPQPPARGPSFGPDGVGW